LVQLEFKGRRELQVAKVRLDFKALLGLAQREQPEHRDQLARKGLRDLQVLLESKAHRGQLQQLVLLGQLARKEHLE
jgi:hypothetical protein